MKYFTVTELCYSDTAKNLGIYNEPTAAVADNLVRLVEKVLDPLREAYGKPIKVNSGYRSKALHFIPVFVSFITYSCRISQKLAQQR